MQRCAVGLGLPAVEAIRTGCSDSPPSAFLSTCFYLLLQHDVTSVYSPGKRVREREKERENTRDKEREREKEIARVEH